VSNIRPIGVVVVVIVDVVIVCVVLAKGLE